MGFHYYYQFSKMASGVRKEAEGSLLVRIPFPRSAWPWQKAVLHSGGSAAWWLMGPELFPVVMSQLFWLWLSPTPPTSGKTGLLPTSWQRCQWKDLSEVLSAWHEF